MECKNLEHFNRPYGTAFVKNHVFHRFENSHAKVKILVISFIDMIPKELVIYGIYQNYLLTPDNEKIYIFETGKLIGKTDFPRKHKPSKFFYHIKNQFKRFLIDIELRIAQEQKQLNQWIETNQKKRADQFFISSFYQSIKDVHVDTDNTKTHYRVEENWVTKMTENTTKIDFIEDSDITEKLNRLKKHEGYYEFN